MLAEGTGGAANREEAIAWFTSAAERNHSDAMVYLAALLSDGDSGQDWAEIKRLLKTAEGMGNTLATERLVYLGLSD